MAVTANTESTKLILKVITGQTESGADKYAQRSFANINPDITTADLYDVAEGISTLQTGDVSKVQRQDTSTLVSE
ncbi:MAG: DUF1659 domain-containing protein [Schwartzia sp.]|nr:DUF1659 domain-containing protein [Schwartzia sp. (in: firmicutes)]